MKNILSLIVALFCLGAVQTAYAETLCYGFTKVEGVRTNGVHIKAVYQNDTSIVLDTVSYHHPMYGDGYFHASRFGALPAGKYDVHFEYGSYFRNKVITYDPEIGPVNMGEVELVKVEFESNDTLIILRNIHMEVIFWRQTGVIRGLTVKGHSGLLSANEPGQIVFRDTLISQEYLQDEDVDSLVYIDTVNTPTQGMISFQINFPNHQALVSYTMDTLGLRWDNHVWLNIENPTRRSLRLDFSLPLLDTMQYAFWADANAPYFIEDYFNKTIIYRENFCILPSVTLYDTTLDYGVSFICPFEVKKPRLQFKLRKTPASDTFRVSYNYMQMYVPQSQAAQTSLYLVPHEGDWRPGLAYMQTRYPEYFTPHDSSQIQDYEGRFFIAGSWTFGELEKIDTCQIFGVKWEEYYHNKAFFGLYVPQDRFKWLGIRDGDSTTTYKYWLRHAGNDYYTYDTITYIMNLFNDHQIGSYPYTQSMEAWKSWVYNDTIPFPFDSSLAKDQDGNPLKAFQACRLMNPDTNLLSFYPPGERSWAAYIDTQITAVLDSFPAAGIFYDRDDYHYYDYAHNDSVTMINTTPVYMLGFALEEINEKICREVHNRNKGILANGPTSVEVCKNIDGIMVERHPEVVSCLQYLGLSRPLILFVIDTLASETETKDKTALYGGLYPSLEANVDEPLSRLIDLKYQPLFNLYKGKTWVLNAHALRLPADIKGNIFKIPDNDLLIPMVNMDRSQVSMDPFRYNLGVKIMFPGLGTYDHCYVLSGDYFGPRWVYYDPTAMDMLNVPEHMVSALVRLSQEPRYEYSSMSSPVLCQGKAGKFKLRVQNLEFGSKQYALLITTPFGNCSFRTFWLRQCEVREIQYDFTIPDTHPLGEDTFWVINTSPTPDDSTLFTVWVYDPVSLELPEDLFIKFPTGDSFPLTLINNTTDTMSVTLTGAFTQGHGEIAFIGNNPVTLPGHGTKEVEVFLELKDTVGTLYITAISNSDTVGSITEQVNRAMRPLPGDIFYDDFNSGSMSSQWYKWDDPNAWSVEDSSAKGSGNYSSYLATVGAGDEGWTNYRFQVNTKMAGSTHPDIPYLKSYVFFRVQNDTQYYRYGIKGDEPRLVLYRRDSLHGWTRLGTYDFQPQKDSWYNLAVKVQGNWIRCFFNGKQVITANDTKYQYGGIGIGITEGNMTNYYDDIVVRPLEPPDTLFADNFDSGVMDTLWNKRQGTWFVPPEEPSFARGSGSTHFATVAEACDWTNYQYQVRTRIIGSASVSWLKSYVFFRVQDDLNYYRFGIHGDAGCIDLYKRVNGIWIFLASYPFKPEQNVWYNLKVEIQSQPHQIKGYLNDSLRISYTDNDNPFINGGIGIGVLEQEGMVTDYDDVLVQPLSGQ